jgi:hypothetical protein
MRVLMSGALILTVFSLAGCSKQAQTVISPPTPVAEPSARAAGGTPPATQSAPSTEPVLPWDPKQGQLTFTNPSCAERYSKSSPDYTKCMTADEDPCAKPGLRIADKFKCEAEETEKSQKNLPSYEAYKTDPFITDPQLKRLLDKEPTEIIT